MTLTDTVPAAPTAATISYLRPDDEWTAPPLAAADPSGLPEPAECSLRRPSKAKRKAAAIKAISLSPKTYPLTQLGNAERLVAAERDNIRCVWATGTWLIWDAAAGHWAENLTGELQRRARRMVRAIGEEMQEIEDMDAADAVWQHALRSESQQNIRAAIELAGSEEGVAIMADQLDQDPWLFNVANGTIDLRTGRLRPHDPADLITRRSPAEFHPDRACPTWLAFLDEIFSGDAEMILFIQRMLGHALTGDTSEQVLPVLIGGGRNGKSVLVNVVLSIMGSYAIQAETGLLLAKATEGHSTGLTDLKGVRLAVTVEPDEGRRLNESLVKALTGGEKMRARRMRADNSEFEVMAKLWMVANHRIVIRGSDKGIWRRIRSVPFSVTIPEERVDRRLTEKLLAERDGILAWMVQGATEWADSLSHADVHRRGYTLPSAVARATNDYQVDMDVVGQFIDECCVVGEEARVRSAEVYAAWRTWSSTTAGEYHVSQKVFSMRLEEKFTKRRSDGIWFHGLRLRADIESPFF